MELQKALQTIKAVCDDSVSNGRFRNIDEVANVTNAFNLVVEACNYAVAQKNKEMGALADAPKEEIVEVSRNEEVAPSEEVPQSEEVAAN